MPRPRLGRAMSPFAKLAISGGCPRCLSSKRKSINMSSAHVHSRRTKAEDRISFRQLRCVGGSAFSMRTSVGREMVLRLLIGTIDKTRDSTDCRGMMGRRVGEKAAGHHGA